MDKPNWIVLKECGEELTKKGITPFTRQDLIKCVQSKYPDRGKDSLNPMIQGMTVNLKGGAPGGEGKKVFFRVKRGLFKLYDEKDTSLTYDHTNQTLETPSNPQPAQPILPTEIHVDQPSEIANRRNLLDVLIMEYTSLRGELADVFDREIQLFTIIVGALGVIYGIIFSEGFYDLILFIPFLILPLTLKYGYGTYSVEKIGKYLKEKIGEQIHEIISQEQLINECLEWKGWQYYWKEEIDKKERKRYIKNYDVMSKYLLFVLIPSGIAFLYSLIIVVSKFYSEYTISLLNVNWSKFNITGPNYQSSLISNYILSKTIIPPTFHIVFMCGYLGFIVYVFIVKYICWKEDD